MNKLQKSLRGLHPQYRPIAEKLLALIVENKLDGLNVRKLKGYTNRYRVRKGKLRILFEQVDGMNEIKKLDSRDDNTYNF